MEEDIKGIQDYIQIFKRYKNQMLLTALSIFLLSVVVAFKLPSIYKSTATILIEQQEIPQELVRSTITSYADQRIQVISQRVMNTENLTGIINKFNLFAKEKKHETASALLEKLRKDIQLEMVSANVVDPRSGQPTQATIAFTLAFNSDSPKLAQQVANELVSLYLNENLKRRSIAAADTTDFLALEANKLRTQITELESALAEFKEKNLNSLPEVQQLNMQLMAKTEQQAAEFDQQIKAFNERKLYLETELAQLNPMQTTYSATGERIHDSKARLEVLQADYIELSARYAPEHPDVVKMRRELAALENEVGGVDKTEINKQIIEKTAELVGLQERYSSEHPDVKKLKNSIDYLENELQIPTKKRRIMDTKPDNPAYIQLGAQLQAVNADIKAFIASKRNLTAKVTDYEKVLKAAPQVERKYHELMRDYDNAMLKYREVKAKQMEADMSKNLEKDRKGERFSLVEPPLFPDEPFKPNRLAIILAGAILAMGGAFGHASLKASLDQAIYGSAALKAIIGDSPLVVIPYIDNNDDVLNRARLQRTRILFILGLIIISTVLIHFLLMPLDVLWYTLLRKFAYFGV